MELDSDYYSTPLTMKLAFVTSLSALPLYFVDPQLSDYCLVATVFLFMLTFVLEIGDGL